MNITEHYTNLSKLIIEANELPGTDDIRIAAENLQDLIEDYEETH